MPTPIQNATSWTKLQQAFGILGRHKLLLDEVVVPVALIEDLTPALGQQGDDATAFWTVSAVPAKRGAAVIANIGDTGVVLFIDTITVYPTASSKFNLVTSTLAPIIPHAGSVLNKVWNDPNQPGTPAGGIFANEDIFAPATLIASANVLANSPYTLHPRWVLSTDTVLSIALQTVNLAFSVQMQYRVRSA